MNDTLPETLSDLVAFADRIKRGTRASESLRFCDAIENVARCTRPAKAILPAECPECAKVKAAEAKRKADNVKRVTASRKRRKAEKAGRGGAA